MRRGVRNRVQVGHGAHGGVPAPGRRQAARLQGLLIRKTRLSEMHMYITEAGKKEYIIRYPGDTASLSISVQRLRMEQFTHVWLLSSWDAGPNPAVMSVQTAVLFTISPVPCQAEPPSMAYVCLLLLLSGLPDPGAFSPSIPGPCAHPAPPAKKSALPVFGRAPWSYSRETMQRSTSAMSAVGSKRATTLP